MISSFSTSRTNKHYWLGLLNILSLFETKPEHFFGILPNRSFHDKQKIPLLPIYHELDGLPAEVSSTWNTDWLHKGNLWYLIISRGTLFEHSSPPSLCLHGNLYIGFHLFLFWLFSYVRNIFLMQCLLLQRALLLNFSFLSNFFWKLEFFHHLHLFYITWLLILRWISACIIAIAITV